MKGIEQETAEEEEREEMVVVVPYPGQGHINPMFQLALRLSATTRVTFACPRCNLQSILRVWEQQQQQQQQEQEQEQDPQQEQEEEQARAASRLNKLKLEPLDDDGLPPRSMERIAEFVSACSLLKHPLQRLLRDAQAYSRISAIISDSILSWAADLAADLGVPWIAYFPLPASSLLAFTSQPAVAADGLVRIRGLPALRQRDLPVSFGVIPNEALWKAEWVILNTCDELERNELQAAGEVLHQRVLPIGPLQPLELLKGASVAAAAAGIASNNSNIGKAVLTAAMREEETQACLSWLQTVGASSSVLYISFGSIACVELEDMNKLLEALVSTGVHFVWVLRTEHVKGMSENDWGRFASTTARGLVLRWAPQLKLLRHRSITAFLTHCGWNSTFESICAGIPMLTWPCFADQPLNAFYVVQVWRVGLSMPKASSAEMAGVLKDMMSGAVGEELRMHAAALGDRCRGASEQGTANLASLVQKLHTRLAQGKPPFDALERS